eukprot:TRINITY_DN12250_c0_g1_i1.p2 TRINITY_DN12250_c0_g1~~TRINITY_DN12250_c0_g1_i1.p2  ORF type:complete len:311 (-),score=92.95 TRINITY_DN12250_c0_g1_i1:148-1080(-)
MCAGGIEEERRRKERELSEESLSFLLRSSSIPPAHMSNIHGFGDLPDDKKEKKSDEKQNNYYTGGTSSGLNVESPAPPKTASDQIDSVFESAKSHGAVNKYEEEKEGAGRFTGAGATLSGGVQPAAPAPPKVDRKILTFYKNCFTIDDGPPRRYNDPANRSFLDDINKGQVPRELQQSVNGEDLDVELINKKTEEWKDVPKQFKAFQTSGNVLTSSSSGGGSQATAKAVVVDDTKKATTLQVRLHDGSRMKVRLNLTHTIGELRSHIEANHPTGKAFELRTTFPPKALSDDSLSIEAAGLANAAVVQRLT